MKLTCFYRFGLGYGKEKANVERTTGDFRTYRGDGLSHRISGFRVFFNLQGIGLDIPCNSIRHLSGLCRTRRIVIRKRQTICGILRDDGRRFWMGLDVIHHRNHLVRNIRIIYRWVLVGSRLLVPCWRSL